MIVKTSGRRWALPAFAAALLIGAAPAVHAACPEGGGTTAGKTWGEQQAEAATGESGQTVGQSLTTPPDTEAAESEITTDQGGTTMDESGTATPQAGAADTADQSAGTTAEAQAVTGADEERIRTMLEEQGYTEVSSIASCGTYYEAEAVQDGKQVTLQIDRETGRISPPQ